LLDRTAYWGRLTESAVGAHLANSIRGKGLKLYYWNDRNYEVDFVLTWGKKIAAIEVKSGGRKKICPALSLFSPNNTISKKWLVGADGIPVENSAHAAEELLM
jgi:predicted AAA+ superfamily ATPase